MGRKLTNKEEIIMRIKRMDKVESILKHAMTTGATVWAIKIIADKLEQIAYTAGIFMLIIIAFIIYSVKQHKFIGDKTAQMTAHNQELEKKIDPNRTSSQLTSRGKTNPLDK